MPEPDGSPSPAWQSKHKKQYLYSEEDDIDEDDIDEEMTPLDNSCDGSDDQEMSLCPTISNNNYNHNHSNRKPTNVSVNLETVDFMKIFHSEYEKFAGNEHFSQASRLLTDETFGGKQLQKVIQFVISNDTDKNLVNNVRSMESATKLQCSGGAKGKIYRKIEAISTVIGDVSKAEINDENNKSKLGYGSTQFLNNVFVNHKQTSSINYYSGSNICDLKCKTGTYNSDADKKGMNK